MASDILWDTRRGVEVISNFDVTLKKHQELFHHVDNWELTPAFLNEFAEDYYQGHEYHEGAIKLYMDECQVILGAREWNAPDRKAWNTFLQQHRKLGYDVYLIAQSDKYLDKNIRGLIEYEVQHRTLNNVGLVGKAIGLLALNHKIFVANTYYYGMRYRLGSQFLLGSKHIYDIYSTRKTFSRIDMDRVKESMGHVS